MIAAITAGAVVAGAVEAGAVVAGAVVAGAVEAGAVEAAVAIKSVNVRVCALRLVRAYPRKNLKKAYNPGRSIEQSVDLRRYTDPTLPPKHERFTPLFSDWRTGGCH